MNENLLLILDEEAFRYIYDDLDKMDYFNYLTHIYKQIEAYKINHINFIEYIIVKKDLDNFLNKKNINIEQIKDNIDILSTIDINNLMPLDKSYPKVPDYLLKYNENFLIPLQIIHKDSNKVFLFENIQIDSDTINKIHNLITKNTFIDKKLHKIKEHLVRGQETVISSNILSLNSFVYNGYAYQFELNNKKADSLRLENSPYDYLCVSPQHSSFFTIKLLHLHFEGSFFEYRNFIYNHIHFISEIKDILQNYFSKKYNNELIVQPMIDRFITEHSIEKIHQELLKSYTSISLYKDQEKLNFQIPVDVSSIDVRKLKMKNGYIYLSNFNKNNIQNIKKDNKISRNQNINNEKSDKEKNVSLERIKEIHNKKFPDKPFPY